MLCGVNTKEHQVLNNSIQFATQILPFLKLKKNSTETNTIMGSIIPHHQHFDFRIRKKVLEFISNFVLYYYDFLDGYISCFIPVNNLLSILFSYFFFFFYFFCFFFFFFIFIFIFVFVFLLFLF